MLKSVIQHKTKSASRYEKNTECNYNLTLKSLTKIE